MIHITFSGDAGHFTHFSMQVSLGMLGTLTYKQIEKLLHDNVTGRIGCSDGAKVYIVPVNYAYNDKYLILQSAEGMKIDIMRKHPQVCFQVDEITDQTNWKSVVAWGTYEEIRDEKEKYYAMKYLVGRITHRRLSETFRAAPLDGMNEEQYEQVVQRTIIYRIRLSEKTGRFESTENI